jgi:hypothetical protein
VCGKESVWMGYVELKCIVFKYIFNFLLIFYNVMLQNTYIHTYHSRFNPEGVAEVSQIFLRHTHVLPKLVSYEEHCRRDKWQAHHRPIAVHLRYEYC